MVAEREVSTPLITEPAIGHDSDLVPQTRTEPIRHVTLSARHSGDMNQVHQDIRRTAAYVFRLYAVKISA